ncbi:MAG: hypothetical protein GY898_29505 [Proteobacteria bacterium]|nr:hypothetical protein [Pseudomonadota bacterium]
MGATGVLRIVAIAWFVLSGVGPAWAEDEAPPWERDDEDDEPSDEDEDNEPDDDDDPPLEDEVEGNEFDWDDGDDDDDDDDDDDEYDETDDLDYGDGDEAAPEDPIDEYRRREMRMERNPSADEYPNAFAALFRVRPPWSVRRGDDTLVTPLAIARGLGDKRTANKVLGQQIGGIAGGGGAFLLGASLLVGGGAAVAAQRGNTREGRGRTDAATANRLLTAGAILGPILMATGACVTIGVVRRTRQAGWYYERDDAEDAIEDLNDDLRNELDLERRDLRRGARPGSPGIEVRIAAASPWPGDQPGVISIETSPAAVPEQVTSRAPAS